ncbi:MAG TPA: radical SAM protein [bacterium]|nr:radical SAM protein [bacterium]HMW32064.1 radical SAM protein [bacterium]HMW36497.1 radical SAM protein [bacterium]HMY36290.1 radical SAM protein [bacterium]HMZ03686.1 radical SAM protein [bacterium]
MQNTILRDTLKVNEIFYSIQGESTHAGKPCIFVRLTYCNLRCTYCDTEYAFYSGRDMTVEDVIRTVQSYTCKTVEVTGGEPLLQERVYDLMIRLCDMGFEVMIETGGSLDVEKIDPRVLKIVDMKCPSSGMQDKNYYPNLNKLLPTDELKFVIGDRNDYEWAKALIAQYPHTKQINSILFSPVFDTIEPVSMVNWMLEDKLQTIVPNIRFQIQLHKVIWSPETRGV